MANIISLPARRYYYIPSLAIARWNDTDKILKQTSLSRRQNMLAGVIQHQVEYHAL